MLKKFSFTNIIATFFGLGYIPIAPGTFGSLAAFPLYLLLNYIAITAIGGVNGIAAPMLINSLMIFIVALFFIGVWASNGYCIATGKQDPKEIVIDEVVGQLLTICLIIFMLPFIGFDALMKVQQHGIDELNFVMLNMLSAFIMFRFFDILKPWPINYIDKNYKNGFGIMLDDVIAASFAVIMHFFVLFAMIDRL